MSVDEIDRLQRKTNWLDRNRRRLSVGIAAVVIAPLMTLGLVLWLPPEWPKVHIVSVSIALASACWYGLELALGLVQAVWETDLNKLTGPAELPRAEVIERRK